MFPCISRQKGLRCNHTNGYLANNADRRRKISIANLGQLLVRCQFMISVDCGGYSVTFSRTQHTPLRMCVIAYEMLQSECSDVETGGGMRRKFANECQKSSYQILMFETERC